jgi:hypothetical protein
MSTKERAGRQKNKLDSWVTTGSNKGAKSEDDTFERPIHLGAEGKTSTGFSSHAKGVATLVAGDVRSLADSASSQPGQKRSRLDDDNDLTAQKKLLVECPICNLKIAESDINEHLDLLHL